MHNRNVRLASLGYFFASASADSTALPTPFWNLLASTLGSAGTERLAPHPQTTRTQTAASAPATEFIWAFHAAWHQSRRVLAGRLALPDRTAERPQAATGLLPN